MARVNFVSRAKGLAKTAVEYENLGAAEEAKQFYVLAVRAFALAIKYEENPVKKEELKVSQNKCLVRAEELAGGCPSDAVPSPPVGHPITKANEVDAALQNVIVRESPNVKWDDIAGLSEAKRLLKEAVIMPQRFPELFVGELRPWSGILLYGPPGTGKSFLAKAVATESGGSTFFSVSAAHLISKWVGESPKIVQRLFEMARNQRPAIIFFDEIDAICQARGTDGDRTSEASRQLLTQLLLELDGVGKSIDGVTVIGATNMPWVIDAAMRRRLQKRIYIPLPDARARAALFRTRLALVGHTFQRDDFSTLATLTENFSGSDISNAVREALYIPLRMAQDATHFKKIANKWSPCSPGDPAGIPMEWEEVPQGTLVLPTLALSHLLQSVANTRPSVSLKDLDAFVEFTREFGQEG